MLRHKNRMSPHRCLLAVIDDFPRCQSFANEISRMFPYLIHTFFGNIIAVIGL